MKKNVRGRIIVFGITLSFLAALAGDKKDEVFVTPANAETATTVPAPTPVKKRSNAQSSDRNADGVRQLLRTNPAESDAGHIMEEEGIGYGMKEKVEKMRQVAEEIHKPKKNGGE